MPDLAAGTLIALRKVSSQNLVRIDFDGDLTELAAAGKIYASTVDGIADTVDGEYFFVAEDGADSLPLYLNDTEVAVDQGVALPTKAALDAFMAAPPFAAGIPGGLLVNDSGRSDIADPAWVAPADLSDQPIFPVDILTAGNIQLQKTSTVSSFTATPTGGKLRFKPSASDGGFRVAGTPIQIGVGDIVRAKLELVAAPEGIQWGFALAVLQSAPTLGGSMVSLASDTPIVSARGDNGGIVLQNPAVATYPDSSASTSPSPATWAEGQVIELVYEVLSSTSAKVTILIDGGNEASRTFSDFPATGYVAPGVYLVNTNDQADVETPAIHHPSPAMPRYLHLLGDAADGTGTDRNPFGTLAEAVADYRYDSSRRTLDLTLKGGVAEQAIFAGTLPFDLAGLRELTIRSTVGTRAKIDASTAISPTFTQIGSSEVWYFPTPPFLDNNATWGSLICVTDGITQTFGNTGFEHVVEGFRFPGRLGINIAYDDVSFVRGRLSVHLAGTYAGNTLVRLWDGSDPNDHDWRWSQHSACIYLPATDQDGWNARRFNMENLDLFGGFSFGVYADRWMLDWTSLAARAIVSGFPFEMNRCGGVVRALLADGFAVDAFHTSDGGTKSLAGADPELWLYDCIARGGATFTAADGFSNHGLAQWYIRNGEVTAPGKDCISTTGNIDAQDILLQGAVGNGISLAQTAANVAANGAYRTAALRRSTIRGNVVGAVVNIGTGTEDATSILTLDDILFDTNTTNSLQIINLGTDVTAEVQYDRLRFAGATPSFGSDFNNSGGTFTPLVTRAVVP